MQKIELHSKVHFLNNPENELKQKLKEYLILIVKNLLFSLVLSLFLSLSLRIGNSLRLIDEWRVFASG